MFQGSFVALITPFKDGKVDESAFRNFVNWQIEQGTNGLVPCGTTGETPTLSHDEHKRTVEVCIEVAAGRVPVMAGAGSNSTAEAIELTLHAQKAGADAALVVTPYYNKPSQEGLIAHYTAIHEASDIPIFIYNIPGRSVVDMTVETMAVLAKLPRIVGVKDATSDLARPILTKAACGDDFCQMSGEDATAIPYLAAGGHGCISVTANVAPALCAMQHKAWQDGDAAQAMRIQDKLIALHSAMFCATSPGPVKYAAMQLGLCDDSVRLPLVDIADAAKHQVDQALVALGLTT